MGSALHTVSIAEILGLGDEVRTQNPEIKWTSAKTPRAYIRPYVDRLIDGRVQRVQERIYLTATAKKAAITERTKIMGVINQSKYVVQAQICFGDVLDSYLKEYVHKPGELGELTRRRYESQIKNHLRTAFAALPLVQVTTRIINQWLGEKAASGMASATRASLRNLLSGVFTWARDAGLWKEANPALYASVGKHRAVRVPVKLTADQTRRLLIALPEDVRLICEVALYCTCRISEVLGLMWKHVDLKAAGIHVEQRYSRGDLDIVKSQKSRRWIPIGDLVADLKRIGPGEPDEFVFGVKTHVGRRKQPGISRDDRDINQHFLRPAAKALGIYRLGFGFHAFRREAVTEHSRTAGQGQAQKMAGHAKASMTQDYTLSDQAVQRKSVKALQKKVRGNLLVMGKGA